MKFTSNTPKPAAEAAVKLSPTASIIEIRCGGCTFFISKLDANNPFDGFCHAFPPKSIPTGFRWAKTASCEFGCGLFKKRG